MRQHGRGPFPIPFPISPSQPRCFDAARNTAIGRYDQSRLGGMCLCVCLLVCACSCVRVSVCVLVRACLCARLCVCKRAAAAAIGGRLLGIRSSAVHVPLYLSSVPTRTAEPQSSSGAGAGAHHFSASSPIFLRSPSPRAVPLARNHRALAPSPALFPRRNPPIFTLAVRRPRKPVTPLAASIHRPKLHRRRSTYIQLRAARGFSFNANLSARLAKLPQSSRPTTINLTFRVQFALASLALPSRTSKQPRPKQHKAKQREDPPSPPNPIWPATHKPAPGAGSPPPAMRKPAQNSGWVNSRTYRHCLYPRRS